MADVTMGVGETLIVDGRVTNIGDTSDSKDVELLVDGTPVETTTLTLAPFEDGTYSTLLVSDWATTAEDIGTHTVTLQSEDDSDSIEVEVSLAAMGTLLDSFERDELDIYFGDVDPFYIDTNYATDGMRSLRADWSGNQATILTARGVEGTPSRGMVFEWDTQVTINGTDVFSNHLQDVFFGGNEYRGRVRYEPNTFEGTPAAVELMGPTEESVQTITGLGTGTHTLSHKVSWGEPTITYEVSGDINAAVAINDETVDLGGFGWGVNVGGPVPDANFWFDNARITGGV